MGEDVLGTTSESNGRKGTLIVDALRCMEGHGAVLLPGKAEGSGHRHCAVPGVEGGVPAMIESCVSVAPDMNECEEEEPVRESVRACVDPKSLRLCSHDDSCRQHRLHA